MDATLELFFNASRGATGRSVGSGESVRMNHNTQDINDLLAGRTSSQSTENLIVRSQVTVKSEKIVANPVKANLSERANEFMHESSSIDKSSQHISRQSGQQGHDQFQQFMLQIFKNM